MRITQGVIGSAAISILALMTPSSITVAQDSLSLPAQKQTVSTESAEIAFYETGNPDGRPVLFVHGMPFSSYIWRNVLPAMDQDAYRLIAVDLVGFGDSAGAGYGVLDQVAHLDDFIQALDLHDVVLMSQDWGAGISLMWASQNPEDVTGFAFIEGAMPPVYPRPAYDEMPEPIAVMFRSMREGNAERNVLENNLWLDTILPTMVAKPLPAAVTAEYNRPFLTPESRQPLLEMSRTLPIGGEPADVVAAYSNAVDWWTSTDLPKLVLYAEPGRLYPKKFADWNVENVQGVTLTSIGEGLHAVQEENPEAVAEALGAWLATLPAAEPANN